MIIVILNEAYIFISNEILSMHLSETTPNVFFLSNRTLFQIKTSDERLIFLIPVNNMTCLISM